MNHVVDHASFGLERTNIEWHIPAPDSSFDPRRCRHTSPLWRTCPKCRLIPAGWESWPLRAGLDRELGKSGGNTEEAELKRRKDFYSWMYFGVLSSYFEHTVDLSRFVKDVHHTPGGRWASEKELDTTCLHEELTRWHQSMLRRSEKGYLEWSSSVDSLFTAVTAECRKLGARSPWDRTLPKGAEIAMQLLYETLDCAKQRIDGVERSRYDWAIADDEMSKEAKRGHWCASEFLRMKRSVSIPLYALHLGDRRRADLHYHCSELDCKKYQIVEKDYCVRHVGDRVANDPPTLPQGFKTGFDPTMNTLTSRIEITTTCKLGPDARDCDMVSIGTGGLVDTILDKNLVPLVVCNARGDVTMVGSRLEDCKYIAISHVWSDGAGNPVANSLPRCQVLQIRSQMQMLGVAHSVFLDTLCIPVARPTASASRDAEGEEYHGSASGGRAAEARNRMIAMLNEIYSKASVVLVRDRQLMAYPALRDSKREKKSVEFAFRVIFSPWFTRIWTLQEAVAATRLKFCASDCLVDLHEMANAIRTQRPPWQLLPTRSGQRPQPYTRDLWDFLDLNLQSLVQSHQHGLALVRKADNVFVAAAHRRTSHVEDELACLCGLMGFTQDEMMQLLKYNNDEDRTIHFIRTLSRVPHCLVTKNTRRLSLPGFRWCPRRIVHKWAVQESNLLEVTPQGVLGSWKALYLTLPQSLRLFWEEPRVADIGKSRTHSRFRIDVPVERRRGPPSRLSFGFVTVMKDFSAFMRDAARRHVQLAVLTPEDQDGTSRTTNSVLVQLSGHKVNGANVANRIAPCGLLVMDPSSEEMQGSVAPGVIDEAKDGKDLWLIDGDGKWLDD